MQAKYAITLGCMILCGPGFDLLDFFLDVSMPLWNEIVAWCRDVQVLGVAMLGCYFVTYENIKAKAALFVIALWRVLVIVVNLFGCDPVISPVVILSLNAVYILWLYRMISLKPIESEDPPPQYAYNVLRPIHSYWGLLQAVFLPWHHPLYETRIIAQGDDVWLVYQGSFRKMEARFTNILLKGTKVSLNRALTDSEINSLDYLVGKRSIPGIRDCRKFTV